MRCIMPHEPREVSQPDGVRRAARHEQAEGVARGAAPVQQQRAALLTLDAGERLVYHGQHLET